jgi:hypothetical protein
MPHIQTELPARLQNTRQTNLQNLTHTTRQQVALQPTRHWPVMAHLMSNMRPLTWLSSALSKGEDHTVSRFCGRPQKEASRGGGLPADVARSSFLCRTGLRPSRRVSQPPADEPTDVLVHRPAPCPLTPVPFSCWAQKKRGNSRCPALALDSFLLYLNMNSVPGVPVGGGAKMTAISSTVSALS